MSALPLCLPLSLAMGRWLCAAENDAKRGNIDMVGATACTKTAAARESFSMQRAAVASKSSFGTDGRELVSSCVIMHSRLCQWMDTTFRTGMDNNGQWLWT